MDTIHTLEVTIQPPGWFVDTFIDENGSQVFVRVIAALPDNQFTFMRVHHPDLLVEQRDAFWVGVGQHWERLPMYQTLTEVEPLRAAFANWQVVHHHYYFTTEDQHERPIVLYGVDESAPEDDEALPCFGLLLDPNDLFRGTQRILIQANCVSEFRPALDLMIDLLPRMSRSQADTYEVPGFESPAPFSYDPQGHLIIETHTHDWEKCRVFGRRAASDPVQGDYPYFYCYLSHGEDDDDEERDENIGYFDSGCETNFMIPEGVCLLDLTEFTPDQAERMAETVKNFGIEVGRKKVGLNDPSHPLFGLVPA